MNTQQRRFASGIAAAIVLAGLLPLVLYWPSFVQPAVWDAAPARIVPLFQQWLLVVTAFGVKPGYMLLSLLLIIWLWRHEAPDLSALRWGFVAFLAGELACAVNYVLLGGASAVIDFLHSYGMAVGFSFVAYAGLEAADRRLIKYSAPQDRCAALSLCRACIKYADVPCGLRRLFHLLIPVLAILALMLPCAALRATAYRAAILNSMQEFSDPVWSQLFETRYCAVLSITLLLVSWAILAFKKTAAVSLSKVFFAAAVGPLGFGFMRLLLRAAYAGNLVWSNIWEEWTEFIFVAGTGFVLWVFRDSLVRQRAEADNPATVSTAAP